MPTRNAQNTIKTGNLSSHQHLHPSETAREPSAQPPGTGRCPHCGAAVPPKPGFRWSSLKCGRCGASMGSGNKR